MVQNGAKWYALFKLMILSNPSKGGICRHSSNNSHGITKIGNKLVKGKIFLDDESLTVTARKFVEHLKEVKCKCGVKPILDGSDSEKSSPQSQNRVPAQVVDTPCGSSYFIKVGFHIYYINTGLSNK